MQLINNAQYAIHKKLIRDDVSCLKSIDVLKARDKEQLNNPTFKPLEFEWFKKEAGANGFIREGLPQSDRLFRLNQIAIYQMNSFLKNPPKSIQELKKLP